MKILFCQPTLEYSGSELSLYDVVRGIGETTDHELFLLAGRPGPIEDDFRSRVKRLEIVDAPKLSRRTSLIAYVRSFWTVFRAIRAFKKAEGPAPVYVNTVTFPQAVVGAALNRLTAIVHVHEVESTYPALYYRLCMALAARAAARVVCVCRFITAQRGIPWRRRFVARSAVVYNASGFDPPAAERRVEGVLRVLAVCPVSRRKGVADLVEFADRLRRRLGDRPFEIRVAGRIGDEELYNTIRARADTMGLSGALVFCGEQRDLGPLYRNAHILVHPSHSEAFPRVLVEAASFSLPAVTTDAGGSAEAVADGETGFVVPVGDGEAMARRVAELATDDGLYARVAAAAFRRYRQLYTRPRMTAQIREILEDAA